MNIENLEKHIEWEKYYDPNFDWKSIPFYSFHNLSENFIREFKDKIDWAGVCAFQTLSEDFMREVKDKLVWSYVSRYQILSEKFVEEFKNEVSWNFIIRYQKHLSKDFIERVIKSLKFSNF